VAGYLVKRVLQSMLVILGVVTLMFLVLRLSGDPVALLLGMEATPEQVEQVRRNMGFDRGIHVQYLSFLTSLARGDFGRSIRFNSPTLSMVLERLPASLELAVVSCVLATVFAVPLGVVAAVKRNSLLDNISIFLSLLGQSVPTFWLGIMAILFFSVKLKIFPTSGSGSVKHLILPTVSLAAYSMARIARLTRSAMLDVLGQDYLRTARAKGLTERVVIYRHALLNASIPIVTVVAFMFATVMGGSIVTEVVFAWPGVGRLLVEAVHNRDYPLAQTCVFFIAIFVTAVNLLADIVYMAIDPRIRLGE
jgi:peptide/nickel transport system permease protein